MSLHRRLYFLAGLIVLLSLGALTAYVWMIERAHAQRRVRMAI